MATQTNRQTGKQSDRQKTQRGEKSNIKEVILGC